MSVIHHSPLNIEQIERNFREIASPLTEAEAILEANRCVYCYDAPCMHACPTHIDVPSFIKKIASGNLSGSARVIFDANPIGATCARVCPVEVLCEGACVENTLMQKPIEIGRLQRYATDFVMSRKRGVLKAGAPNGKSVGIIGSGPAGLSCATFLARLGYAVTIYDKKPLPGGLDTYGMAEYKMTQAVSVGEAEMVQRLGVEFRQNTEVGRHVSLKDLEEKHDAIFLAIGLGATNRLNILDENLSGVMDALDFIERIKTREWSKVPFGKTVAVIGAGNTAVDAVTQAKRLGAERVLMVYRKTDKEMPAYEYEYDLAKRDGVEFVWQAAPIAILPGENGSPLTLRCEKTDGSNRIFEIPCDMVIKAIGQQKQRFFLEHIPDLELDAGGRVVVNNDTMQTTNPKYFAGGDCVNGGKEAVDAAQMGKIAAQGIHFSLTGEKIEFAGARLPVLENNERNEHH
ncbi:MAG: NAD(P)-dependent oxidoreductase [Acidobacteriota bacterium]|nr:NAD(P)-dependent oxidoreductase [Acidobacteriota bacterium]